MNQRSHLSGRLRTLARAILVFIVLVSFVPVATGSTQVRAQDVVEHVVLSGMNEIQGFEPAALAVRLSRSTSFVREKDLQPDIEIEGDGRFVGLLLVHQHYRLAVLVGGIALCGAPGCPSDDGRTPVLMFGGEHGLDEGGRLPAGDYILYVITDGAPATVRLHLHDLEGTSTLRPNRPARLHFREPTVRLWSPEARIAYENQDLVEFSGTGGITFDITRVHTDEWIVGRVGTCIYRGEPPSAALVAYAPGCVGGTRASITDPTVRTNAHQRDYFGLTRFYAPGQWTIGTDVQGGGRIDRVESLAFDLDLDDEFQ